jgi:gamma-glutamyltranspeptidase/glutathione hydrolase
MAKTRLGWRVVMLTAALGGCALNDPSFDANAVVDHGASRMAVSANPVATAAGLEILRAGGSAVDAAIAMQAVLGLVEPQASGLLGGGVMLVWTPSKPVVQSFDGMATAPQSATQSLSLGRSGNLIDPRETAFSPRSVGVPGVLPAAWAAHRTYGKLPWGRLFARAASLAEDGVAMSKQLHDLLVEAGAAQAVGALRTPYLAANGDVVPVGGMFRNAAYAAVLRRVAQLGPEGIWAEGGARAALDTLGKPPRASWITEADLRSATPRVGDALCAPWQGMRICTAPAPSIGGFVMLQILAMAPPGDAADPSHVHTALEASRLAEADRRRYLADPAFVDVPTGRLLDPAYLTARAALIEPATTMTRPRPGDLVEARATTEEPGDPQAATSTLAVVDADGVAVSMTSTINLHFGARIGTQGMIFNNALVNFAPPPPTTLKQLGGRYANEMAPGKRPVSPIAPVIVLGADGRPVLIGGGAGGAPIPDVMARVLQDVLLRRRSVGDALATGQFHAADPDHIALEEGTAAADLRPALEALGHRVAIEPISTGTAILLRGADGWSGRSDPRRDGGPAQGIR